ncbi:MAG TPA: hypothetical protein PLB89_01925 [Flavobacteriales bacterium]|nr:hypothetical protein [Flavobacteriales bacterium]
MSTTSRPLAYLAALCLLATSCATMQPTADVRDDVYFLPSMEPVTASVVPMDHAQDGIPAEQPTDDYFDAATSNELEADRSYYDMTYNDPYYYNYGRFGFDAGISGYQTGWNGPGWGMSMGYGYGSGNCWGSGYGTSMAWSVGWNSNYYNPYGPYSSFGTCDPYYSGYNCYGYNGGYGYGNYQGPYGSCYACYTPVIVGGTSNVVVGHRPSMGSGGGMRTSPGTSRTTLRDPIRLAPTPADTQRARVGERKNTGLDHARDQRMNDPARRTTVQPNTGKPNRSNTTRTSERTSDPGRSNGGGSSAPSRSGGGGSGGTRTSPSRR